MTSFKNSEAGAVVLDLVKTIHENRDYLSEIDGKIGDGDHGINMDKGFTLCGKRLEGKTVSLPEGMSVLSQILMTEIGGSMGPLYGVLFDGMSEASTKEETIDKAVFGKMIQAARDGIEDIGGGHRGDKTLLDTLIPAQEAYETALQAGKSFSECLEALKSAAEEGWQSTKDMVAKLGRASRLGERSRGVLDAGATSCFLILNSISSSIQNLLK